MITELDKMVQTIQGEIDNKILLSPIDGEQWKLVASLSESYDLNSNEIPEINLKLVRLEG